MSWSTTPLERLGELCEQMTFVGGAAVPFLITEAGGRDPRPTDDVDVAIELTSRRDFYELENALRSVGFQNAIEGPISRFRHGLLVLDVTPTNPEIIGFTNRWYKSAMCSAFRHTLENGIAINVIAPACFLATKMEAFDSPTRENGGDLYASRDFEDVVTVIDGRPNIGQDVLAADAELRVTCKAALRGSSVNTIYLRESKPTLLPRDVRLLSPTE